MRLSPYLEVIIAGMIWGSSGAFAKGLELPATSVSFFRLTIPTILILLYMWHTKQDVGYMLDKWMLGASILSAVSILLAFVAFTTTTIANAVIMLYTWPVLVALLNRLLGREQSGKTGWLIMLAFLGIIIMNLGQELSFQNKDFIGMLAMLFSSLLWAIELIIYKQEGHKYTRSQIILSQNLVGAIILIPAIFLITPRPSAHQWALGITFGIMIGIVAYIFFYGALKKIDAVEASMLSYTEVLSAITFGIVLFGEVLTWKILLGGACIIIAAMLLQRNARVKRAIPEGI